jgi:hypothetical protein
MTLIPGSNVTLFIPPHNAWNFDTINAMKLSGYTTISPQCTVVQVDNWRTDYNHLCTLAYYPNRPAFFADLNGVKHVPVGASSSRFGSGPTLTIPQLLDASPEECRTEGICSVTSQLRGMSAYSSGSESLATFSVIMSHPADFDNATHAYNYAYNLALVIKERYNVVTVSGLLSIPLTSSGLPGLYESSSSSSTGGILESSAHSITSHSITHLLLSIFVFTIINFLT